MPLHLRNLQVIDAMSEETKCFTADLFLDGARVGTAKNAGHGGATLIRIADPEIRKRLEREAVALCRPIHPGMSAPEIRPPAAPGPEALEWYVEQLRDDLLGSPPAEPYGDFTDPAYVTGAVLSQLEDLAPGQRPAVLRDALRQVSEDAPAALRPTPRVIIVDLGSGQYAVIPAGFPGPARKAWFQAVIPALAEDKWAIVPLAIGYPDEPDELLVSSGTHKRHAEALSLCLTMAMDAADSANRPRDAKRPLPPTHIAPRPRGRR